MPCLPICRRQLSVGFLVCLLTVGAVHAQNSAPKRVLALYAGHRGYQIVTVLDENIQATLKRRRMLSTEYYAEFMDSPRFASESHGKVLHDYLRGKYSGLKIDVVIALGHRSLSFLLEHGMIYLLKAVFSSTWWSDGNLLTEGISTALGSFPN
jgi:hypothetical protein